MSAPDLDALRARFPALRRVHAGRPVAYFDGPGGTQVPDAVIDAISRYLAEHNANTHWAYPTSVETDALLAASRSAAADFLGGAVDEVAFGNNMTTLTFHVARALGRGFAAGDELVVTDLDHHANVDPWLDLARERGLVVRHVAFDPATAQLDWSAFEAALSPRTRLVALGAASNAFGTINDVARAAALVHARGALLYVDAVHYAAHERVDVKRLGADLLACSSYKFHGPHAGLLWARRELIEKLDVPKLRPAPAEAPERLETGTQNHEGIAGIGAAIDFLASIGGPGPRREALDRAFAWMHGRARALVARLHGGLSALPKVRVLGPPADGARTPTVAFTVAGHSSLAVARHLADRAVFVSNGDFYATTAIARMGFGDDGVVRAGCALYTTEDEVDRLVAGVAEL